MLLTKTNNNITTAPIKGTQPRHHNYEQDNQAGELLKNSQKDQAEHLMIVDMARNDLGKICKIGSIKVPSLFEHRRFSTVHHLESQIQGKLAPNNDLNTVMAAMFPAASITGAPKLRTMEIIKELEQHNRDIYTGSIGLIKPDGNYTFNVAIRTITQNLLNITTMGIGGGIVADSQPDQEWNEIKDKSAFLTNIPQPFGLIETLLLTTKGKIKFQKKHLHRLQRSAHRLGFVCKSKKINKQLTKYAAALTQNKTNPCILRLQLELNGKTTLSNRPFIQSPATLKIKINPEPVDRMDQLSTHKTTRRSHFDHPLQAAKAEGFHDVLFINNLGHITEGAIRAIMLRIAGRWYAPPITDGLLPSIWREQMIKKLQAKEKSLTLTDLEQAEEILMGNSVQGGRRAFL